MKMMEIHFNISKDLQYKMFLLNQNLSGTREVVKRNLQYKMFLLNSADACLLYIEK